MKASLNAGKKFSLLLVGQWTLVLDSKNIPYKIVRQKGFTLLFVPVLLASQACFEICAFLKEAPLKPKTEIVSRTVSLQPIILALLALAFWHALRMGWWGGLGIMPEEWLQKGALSAGKLIGDGEWYRAATALTLHADSQHLLGNCIFGGIVLAVLGLRIGAVNALCLSFFAGITGNLLAVIFRAGSDYSSVGSSTALFATMGILCGLAIALRDMSGWRRVFFPLAAGLAWLAFLGVEGVRVDILAHITGLASGIGFGLLVPKVFPNAIIPFKYTKIFCLIGLILLSASWWLALQ